MMPLQLHRLDMLRSASGESSTDTQMTKSLSASDLIKHALLEENNNDDHLVELICRALYECDVMTLGVIISRADYEFTYGFTKYVLKNCKNLNKYISVRASLKKYLKDMG